ncbi:MAG: CoA pyrophosphatase, partial [Halioglobus sp.]
MIHSAGLLRRIDAGLPLHKKAWKRPLGEGQWPQAAVLVALTEEAEPRVLLGRRAMHLPLHPGEIAFAGGKREVEDLSPWETATREAMEEVGLSLGMIQPLGELEPLMTRTGFEVFPCVASVPAAPDLVVDP